MHRGRLDGIPHAGEEERRATGVNRLGPSRSRLGFTAAWLIAATLLALAIREPSRTFLPPERPMSELAGTELQVRLPARLIALRCIRGTAPDPAFRVDSLET
jgi:hypothetical protein